MSSQLALENNFPSSLYPHFLPFLNFPGPRLTLGWCQCHVPGTMPFGGYEASIRKIQKKGGNKVAHLSLDLAPWPSTVPICPDLAGPSQAV